MNRTRSAALLSLFLVIACTPDDGAPRVSASPSSRGPTAAPQPGLPPAVAATREGILAAAADHDYEGLRDWLEPSVFLSDFGFGIDPIGGWERKGDAPLEIMAALLTMDYAESDSNEGHLFQWPVYDADTKSLSAISPGDRSALLDVMTREEFRRVVPDAEYGYVGPRLGILEDGTWWFFIQEPGP